MMTALGILAAAITLTFMLIVVRFLIRADRALSAAGLTPTATIFRGPIRGDH